VKELFTLIRFYIAARLFWWAFGLIKRDLSYVTQYTWLNVAESIAEASAESFRRARW
jgi:hypothetical protein